MPTLLEKPPQAAAPLVRPSDLLRLRHRWDRWRGILFTLLVGLAATFGVLWAVHPSRQPPENWKIMADIWSGGFFLTILAAIVGWRFGPSSLLDTAQQMDRDLATKNRLEATATLHGSTSPLALAQREETVAYLSREAGGVRPVRLLPWLVTGILLLIVAHLVTLGLWVIPTLLHPTTPAPPPPPKELPKASIIWKSPEPESKANPIEEVPTVAVAQSTTGLKDLSLEISVNGAPKKSVSLPATPYDQPGRKTLKVSLYMDELQVEPFDIVSYYIRAQRITDQKVPDTASAIQFIQVRPFRDDVTQVRGGNGTNKNYDLLIRLKLAQLRSIKENFILAHTDLPVTDPVRAKENNRVGKNQGELSAKTEEVVQAFIQAGCPADMIDLLRRAEPPMDDASKKILATQNVPALLPQQKALNLIVEVEKFFIKIMTDKGSSPPDDNPDDPFKNKQQHELKKRMTAAAGQLETLAKNQTKLANDLSLPGSSDAGNPSAAGTPDSTTNASPGTATPSAQDNPPGTGANPDGSQKEIPLPPAQAVDPFGPDADKGTFTERQIRVLQGIETLLNGNKMLPDAVNNTLQDAQKHATASMHDLDQADEADAREPAANAAQDLQKAVAEMNKAGEEETKLTMEEAQQKLNDLARQLRDLAQKGPPDAQQRLADLARQVQDIRKQLEDAADKQQEAGSAEAAQRLQGLAKAIADQKVQNDLADMGKTGIDVNKALAVAVRLEALAGQAAQSSIPGKPSAQDIAKLINSLERSRANLARLAQQTGGSPPTPTGQNGAAPGQNKEAQDQGQEPGHGQQPGVSQPGQSNPHELPTAVGQAYREVISDLKNEAQLTNATVSGANANGLLKTVIHAEQDTQYRQVNPLNVVSGYQAIAGPLDKLLFELKEAIAHVQREEVVKQPNLDEAPPAYRSAVSDYFETMSKDYHPDSGDEDAKKP